MQQIQPAIPPDTKSAYYGVGLLAGSVEQWKPPKFDWTAAQTLYYKMAAYNYRYAQPPTLNAAQKSFTFL